MKFIAAGTIATLVALARSRQARDLIAAWRTSMLAIAAAAPLPPMSLTTPTEHGSSSIRGPRTQPTPPRRSGVVCCAARLTASSSRA
jgi:hypothetical protein